MVTFRAAPSPLHGGIPPVGVGVGDSGLVPVVGVTVGLSTIVVGVTVGTTVVGVGPVVVFVGTGVWLSFPLSLLSLPQPAIANVATMASARNLVRVFIAAPP
jgi:hypothetical protein